MSRLPQTFTTTDAGETVLIVAGLAVAALAVLIAAGA